MGRRKKERKQLTELRLDAISPSLRLAPENYDRNAIAALAQSLAEEGMRDPILVHTAADEGRYEVLMGGARILAARQLAWETLPALVLGKSLQTEIRAIERLRSEEITPWEMADTLSSLKDKLDWTQTHLGQAIGRTRDYVANLLAITQITPEARSFILAQQNGRELSTRHLRYVARAAHSQQIAVARRILDQKLSTTDLERAKRGTADGAQVVRFSNVREVRKADSRGYPKTAEEWRRYERRLNTDLRRIAHQESLEQKRTWQAISAAKQRQRLVLREAGRRRREIQRELQMVRKRLERLP